jgi:6-phosphogluconolactonase
MLKSSLPSTAAAAIFSIQAHAAHVYVSSPGDGYITQYRLDEHSGQLSLVERVQAGDGVSAMTQSRAEALLFATTRSESENRVSTFQMDRRTGRLQMVSSAALADRMSYLSTNQAGTVLMGASYGGGLVSVQSIASGGRVQDHAHTYATGPNTHSILEHPAGKFVYAAVLGADRISQFTQAPESAQLTPIGTGQVATPTGIGPRHLAFSPDGRFLYVVGELTGTVVGFAIDADTGALTEITRAEGIPPSMGLRRGLIRGAAPVPEELAPHLIWVADIRITPDGSLMYISERTTSSVSAFSIEPDSGQASYIGNYTVAEQQPRNIAISPSGRWLLVSGEKSDVVGNYRIDASGSIERVSQAPAGKSALWIETVPVTENDA